MNKGLALSQAEKLSWVIWLTAEQVGLSEAVAHQLVEAGYAVSKGSRSGIRYRRVQR